MCIYWSKDEDREVFSLAKAVRLREIRKLSFYSMKEEESKELLDYLTSNCPLKLKLFTFDARNTSGYCSGDFYLEGILKVTYCEYL